MKTDDKTDTSATDNRKNQPNIDRQYDTFFRKTVSLQKAIY